MNLRKRHSSWKWEIGSGVGNSFWKSGDELFKGSSPNFVSNIKWV